jgi:hypothetical protein
MLVSTTFSTGRLFQIFLKLTKIIFKLFYKMELHGARATFGISDQHPSYEMHIIENTL